MTTKHQISAPEIMEEELQLIVGVSKSYNQETMSKAGTQWSDFKDKAASIPNTKGHTLYGICYNYNDMGDMDYLTGVEVQNFDDVPSHMEKIRLEPQTYARFEYEGPVNKMDEAWTHIFEEWIPQNEEKYLKGEPMIERYGRDFDPQRMEGRVEILIPLQ